jgi:hypothetical protein
VAGNFEKEGDRRALPSSFPGGAALVDQQGRRGWVLVDDGLIGRLGGALTWGWREGVTHLDVLVQEPALGGANAGVMARRAAEFAHPPAVWSVDGRRLVMAEPALSVIDEDLGLGDMGLGGSSGRFARLMADHGAEVIVEHGVLRGEVLGLEVARVVDGRLEIGVGRHDRAARAEMYPGEEPGFALDRAVAAVRARRRPDQPRHPANTLARGRWLRAVVCAQPSLAGAARLAPVAPPLPWFDLPEAGAAPCLGAAPDGTPLLAVCSVGVEVDLVPTAADCRRIHCPDAHLVLVVPQRDDLPVTHALADSLSEPAEVIVVPRSWDRMLDG